MAKKKRSTKGRSASKPAAVSAGTSNGGLTAATTADLEREIRRRQQNLGKLERRRDKLRDDLAAVEAEIAELGGAVTTGGRRPRNSKNLGDALAGVLAGQIMSVTEAAEAVQKAGYQTTSSSFRTIVNQTLLRDDRFEKVERGRYTAAG